MFPTTTLLGVGLIGGSLALDMRRAGLTQHVIGVGRTAANLETAKTRGIIDEISTDMAGAVSRADLVVLATPVATLEQQIAEVAPHLKPGALLIDVGSVKGRLARAGAAWMRSGQFVPCHPIAGTEKSGAAAAFEGLFKGARCIITASADTPANAVQRARALWEAVGANVVEMTPEAHDRVFARVSHLPHMVAYGLVHFLLGLPGGGEDVKMAGGGFRDFTRIAESPPEMWLDIVKLNRDEVLSCVEGYASAMSAMASLIRDERWEDLRAIFDEARAVKQKMGAGRSQGRGDA